MLIKRDIIDFNKYSITTYVLLASYVLLTFLFFYSITSNDLLVGFASDDAVYLLLADMYSFRTQGEYLFYEDIRRESYFPPVFPMLMGVLGGNSSNPALAATITVSFLLISIFIAGIWIWKETKNTPAAILITLVTFLLPGTLILSQEIWSEYLFMVFVYGAFLVCSLNKLGTREWLFLAILIGLASFTRSVGISLVGAFCLYLIINKVQHGVAYALISGLPFLFWNIAREQYLGRSSYVETFSSSILNLSPQGIIEFLLTKFTIFYNSFVWLFSSVETNLFHEYFSVCIIVIFLIFSLAGFLTRIISFKLDSIFLVSYFFIIFFWPYSNIYFVSRFLFPLVPLLLFYGYAGVNAPFFNTKYSGLIKTSLLVSLLIVSYPSSKQYIERAYLDMSADIAPYRRDRQWLIARSVDDGLKTVQNSKFIINSLKKASEIIPEYECVYAIQAPLVMIHTKRITGILPAPEVSDEEFNLKTQSCNYFLSLPITDNDGRFPMYYPIQRLDDDKYFVSHTYKDPDRDDGLEIFLLERIN